MVTHKLHLSHHITSTKNFKYYHKNTVNVFL